MERSESGRPAEGMAIGSVAALWRYPVKSMLGEELDEAVVSERGIVGDRAYALLDLADGKVASAKHPRKWGQLLNFGAAYVEPPVVGRPLPPVRITLPDGATVGSADDDVDEVLSRATGRPVTLTTTAVGTGTLEEYWPDVEGLAPQEFIDTTLISTDDPAEKVSDIRMGRASPPGSYFDSSVLHLLTTATLDRLGALHPGGRFDPRRYRPNLLVATPGQGFLENDWPGRTLAVGPAVRVRASAPTARCVMTTLAQGDLPLDTEVLRTLARSNRLELPGKGRGWACAGVYADLVTGGTIRRGDTVVLE
jgi:uncharacterized protein